MTNLDRRAVLSGLGALCLSGAAVSGVSLPAMAQTVAAVPVLPVPRLTQSHGVVSLTSVITERPRVALTFDDGPHPQNTPVLLDILAQYRARATFYVIGNNVRRYPDIARRIVAEGHELGNHTWTHPVLSRQGDATVLREIDRTQEIIWQTVGAVPVTMRPPYGAFSQRQMRMLSEARNLPTVIWSVDTNDWRRPGPAVVADRMVRGAQPGSVILAHDIHGPTVRAVPAALQGLLSRGFEMVTLSELLGWDRWGPRGLRVVSARPESWNG